MLRFVLQSIQQPDQPIVGLLFDHRRHGSTAAGIHHLEQQSFMVEEGSKEYVPTGGYIIEATDRHFLHLLHDSFDNVISSFKLIDDASEHEQRAFNIERGGSWL